MVCNSLFIIRFYVVQKITVKTLVKYKFSKELLDNISVEGYGYLNQSRVYKIFGNHTLLTRFFIGIRPVFFRGCWCFLFTNTTNGEMVKTKSKLLHCPGELPNPEQCYASLLSARELPRMPVVQKPGKQKIFLLEFPCFFHRYYSDFNSLQNSLTFT